MEPLMENFPRLVFDEAHSEAWSLSPETARTINPVNPADASYALAAQELVRRGYDVHAHTGGPLTGDVLRPGDVLVIAHPAERGAERVTGSGSPRFSPEELDLVEAFVRGGGGLVVLGECDQDKYGNNLQELLGRFGIAIVSTTVQEGARRHQNVATWVLADIGATVGQGVLAGVAEVCFYRSGVLSLDGAAGAQVLAATSATADPAGQPLAAAVQAGLGRVVAFADSDLFGDDSIEELDHRTLWSNVVTWAAGTATAQDALAASAVSDAADAVELDEHWLALKDAVTRLRPLQSKDGSIDAETHDLAAARRLVDDITREIAALAPRFPHDADYLEAVQVDFRRWADEGFGTPDFLDSLVLFRPDQHRVDGLQHLVVFPMYTQNGNLDRNVEALVINVVWPQWLAELEQTYDNPMFLPVNFVDFTPGYDTNSAVLFPETVAVREVPKFHWGAIFCDREAARFRRISTAAAQTLGLQLPPDAERLVHHQGLAQSAFAMWDLIHDRTHSHGDLPFDPFMIKQRMPFWMYALEELRCDLTTFREAVRLEKQGVPYARLAQYAIVLDRLFRFPITGDRVRNYDGLGGQLLFAYLHRHDVLRWTDNRLSLDWKRLPQAVIDLGLEVEALYREGIDRSRVAHWLASYELVSRYVPTHPSSTWAQGTVALPLDGPPKHLTDAVLPDEFPLNVFYEALRKKLADVIADTSGITA
jgi:Family of unknown function (DUF6421)/Domain of unknown function (DUF4350)